MKIEHVAIYVDDLEAVRHFFEKYFQARSNELYHNKKKGFKSYFLSFDDGARLEIMSKEAIVKKKLPQERLGLIHFAVSTGSKEKVDELTRRLQSDGYPVLSGPRTTGDGYYESCVLGIEDCQIEITV
ncbi:VOC family protein [Streptococcus ratti]|uniref:Glyoxalase/bleomycin resistance protein/dioxygenase n=1 Tax=Streptococcus ratti FA-1 = DSM 20564 TaxID=699248 RepID=A0ABP2R1P2_STRRT|nr:VOC family protein [Streptococcus ratti]EJN93939.1 Glyoxalase/bleomycin resistance protein/dioxygenase [Streptococcus ratti FA-1 = DSM 20564]EMP69651.1 glyoxalase/bleomycin resistance protein/dioxygenase [Streptococcus ratti FA-1 = DSM 20564]QEY07782.1 glyoxalase [Streptococcus ratti]VEI60248.1 Glyoxalase/bleomycin resistance protein/dioxygenase [Streptococcus mutans]